jgi:phosphoribosylamine--glycine ligase
MKVLVIDGGGRGHALGDKLKQSKRVKELFFAPGNAGTEKLGTNIKIRPTDVSLLTSFAMQSKIDLTVVGERDALTAGVVDRFQSEGLRIFGPTKAQARIEEEKAFAKEVMSGAGIPTAPYQTFTNYEGALEHLAGLKTPCFVKASRPARGKGAIPCRTIKEVETALDRLMVKKEHSGAGETVVIEDWLEDKELSAHVVCDGKSTIMFPFSRDHKYALDGDTGDMTGGMGVFAPVKMPGAFTRAVQSTVVERLLEVFPFSGLLYPGLMATKSGPQVLEFNAGFGDSETQVYMTLLESDLLDLLEASIDDTLEHIEVKWRSGFAVCVVLASGGYPGTYQTGYPITGISRAEKVPGVKVFHAGTALHRGELVTNGGRVLGVTAYAPSAKVALSRVYRAVECIHFKDAHFRSDIGKSCLRKAP